MWFKMHLALPLLIVLQIQAGYSVALKDTGKKCAKNEGSILQVYDNKKPTITLIEICADRSTARNFYSSHVALPKVQTGRCPTGFRSDLLSFNPAPSYTIATETQTFKQLLGQSTNYISSTSFLAKGHLAPDADFSKDYSCATYFYVNVAPQWQNINSGNWKSIENRVRNAADKYSGISVVTGTYGTLTLPNERNQPTELFLSPAFTPKRLPVPLYMWKVIYKNNNGIAFITVNNPYLASKAGVIPCGNICQKHGWHKPAYDNLEKGYTFCCEVNSFRSFVDTAPDFSFITGVLNAP